MDGSNLESIAASRQSIYYAPNCKEEASFRKSAKYLLYKLPCLPLFQDGIVVGVLSIIDYLEKEWSQEDLKKLNYFQAFDMIKMNKEGNEYSEEIIEEKIYLNYLTKKYSKKVKDEPPTEREVHCMVVNIRGSKEIFKGVEEKVLKELYEKYGKIIFDVCGKYEAEIDDFFGDTISIIWNPLGQGPLSKNLVIQCALEIQKEIFVNLLPYFKEKGIKRMGVGIGVDGGETFVGNFGSGEEVSYGAFGILKNAEILGKTWQKSFTRKVF